MKTSKKLKIFNIILIVCFSTLLIDFLFGKYFLSNDEIRYRVRHPVFHHTLKKNFSSHKAYWINGYYEINTDKNGFKVSKKNQTRKFKNFDILIIGDSQAEGVGYKAEETYYGYLENKLPKLKIANMSVSSYSSQIYLSKINFFYENGFTFDHIILHYDISDLVDDSFKYDYDVKKKIVLTKGKATNQTEILFNKLLRTFPLTYKTYHFIKNYKEFSDIKGNNVYNIPEGEYMYKKNDNYFENNESKTAIKNTLNLLNKLEALAKKNNSKLSILLTPWPSTLKYYNSDNILEKELKSFCIEKCEFFLNFFPDFLKISKNHGFEKISKKYFLVDFNDQHLSKSGHSFLGKLIYEKFN